jgi:hypothetical protein
MFLKLQYRLQFGRRLNLKEPKLFTEKLQWLKLNNRNPSYARLADKYEVRKHIADTIGGEYLIPLLGVWDSFGDIDFSMLPDKFVLKCTHDSGSVVFCRDKNRFNAAAAEKKLGKIMKRNYDWYAREYPYKNIKPRIICEEYKADESGVELKDYKFFCFNGHPKQIHVDFNRFTGHMKNIYDVDWRYLHLATSYPTDPSVVLDKPACLGEMLDIAGRLSKGFPFLRVDFYLVDGRPYVGELTFFPAGGLMAFDPPEYDAILGDLLTLPGF